MSFLNTDFQATGGTLDDEDARKQRFAAAIAQAQGRDVNANEFRQGQQALGQNLLQTASGQGPSVATQFLAQNQDQNLASANAMAASARGDSNPGMVQRNAQNAVATANQQGAGQAAAIRAQEAIAAQGQLGNMYAQARQGDQSFQNQNDAVAQNYEGMGLSAAQAQLQAQMQAQQINAGIAMQNTKNNTGFWGGLINGAAGALTMGLMKPSSPNTGGGTSLAGGADSGASAAAFAAHGGQVPGQASVPGDSFKNDTVPTMLSPGEVVVPRSIVSHPKFQEILKEIQAKQPKKPSEMPTFGTILAAQAQLHSRMKALEGTKGGK